MADSRHPISGYASPITELYIPVISIHFHVHFDYYLIDFKYFKYNKFVVIIIRSSSMFSDFVSSHYDQ